jgi:hypothetical protein
VRVRELRGMLDEALAGFPPMPVRALNASSQRRSH